MPIDVFNCISTPSSSIHSTSNHSQIPSPWITPSPSPCQVPDMIHGGMKQKLGCHPSVDFHQPWSQLEQREDQGTTVLGQIDIGVSYRWITDSHSCCLHLHLLLPQTCNSVWHSDLPASKKIEALQWKNHPFRSPFTVSTPPQRMNTPWINVFLASLLYINNDGLPCESRQPIYPANPWRWWAWCNGFRLHCKF